MINIYIIFFISGLTKLHKVILMSRFVLLTHMSKKCPGDVNSGMGEYRNDVMRDA